MMRRLDKIDRKILEMLMENCRRPFREIADEVGLSESTIRKRVVKLCDVGIIDKFTISLGEDLDEKKIHAFITILPKSENLKDLIREIRPYPELAEIYSLAGKCGLLVKVNVSDLTELDALIESFKARGDIDQVESVCVVLRRIKEN